MKRRAKQREKEREVAIEAMGVKQEQFPRRNEPVTMSRQRSLMNQQEGEGETGAQMQEGNGDGNDAVAVDEPNATAGYDRYV